MEGPLGLIVPSTPRADRTVAILSPVPAASSMRKALSELILSARGRRPTDAVVAKAARSLVIIARRDGLRAEQMIVTVKSEWTEITGPKRLDGDESLRETQERLISQCIKSFYEPA
jgi:hypothetical protein